MPEPTAAPPAVRLSRRYDAAPHEVWRAWTEAQALSRWFGTGGPGSVISAEADARVGGRFRVSFTGHDGQQHEIGGSYLEVVTDRRLVFSWAWMTTPERESRVTLLFEPAGDGTEMTLVHERLVDAPAREGHAKGWQLTLDKLAHYLALR